MARGGGRGRRNEKNGEKLKKGKRERGSRSRRGEKKREEEERREWEKRVRRKGESINQSIHGTDAEEVHRRTAERKGQKANATPWTPPPFPGRRRGEEKAAETVVGMATC